MKPASKNKYVSSFRDASNSNIEAHKGNAKQEVENEDSSDNSLPNEDLLFTTPCSTLPKQKYVIGLAEYKAILNVIQLQQDVISSRPKFVAANIQNFLNFHMNLLELVPKHLSDEAVKSEMENRNSNRNVTNATVSGDLKAEQFTLSLHSNDLQTLKVSSINVLNTVIRVTKQARVFSFWYAFLPGATLSPFKLGIFDLLAHTSEEVKLAVLGLIQTFFTNASTYLLLANYHCRSSSFTPVCYEFAVCLNNLVMSVTNTFQYGSPTVATAVAKTLVTLLEQVPFHRLQSGILRSIADKLLRLKPDANPVIQIAVLQVCSALMAIDKSKSVSQEIKDFFHEFFQMFSIRSFANMIDSASNDSHFLSQPLDNNIRYVSIQCLGKLAQLDISLFMQNMESGTLKNFENILKTEKDTSLCLHLLRLVKVIGNCGPKCKNDASDSSWIVDKMLHFWSSFFIRPIIFEYIERRSEAILRAALCDCLSEVGDLVFSLLPTDRRMLCVTYLLRKCCVEEGSDSRVVTTSQVRGIGMLVSWPTCYSDSAILIDSAEILLDVLGRDKDSNTHRNVALSGSWALANLVDALAKQSKAGSGLVGIDTLTAASDAALDHETVDEMLSISGDLEFPPHLTLQLAKVAIRYASNAHNLMNIRANCCRCLGALIRCLEGIVYEQVEPNLFQCNIEFRSVTIDLVDAIIFNVSTGKAMKVRWNACYAAGGVLKPSILFEDKELMSKRSLLIDSLLPLAENFPNFKVRISAAFAMSCVKSRQVFGAQFCNVCLAMVRGLDTVHDVSDEEEVQHRADLVDQLCITFCHLLSLADSKDLEELNRSLMENYSIDTLKQSLKTVALRISPEKASIMISVRLQLQEKFKDKPQCNDYSDDTNCILTLFSNLEYVLF